MSILIKNGRIVTAVDDTVADLLIEGNPQTHHMRVDYTPYEGLKVRGHPATVISRGKIVCHHGEFRGHPGAGRFVRRDPSGFVVCWNQPRPVWERDPGDGRAGRGAAR